MNWAVKFLLVRDIILSFFLLDNKSISNSLRFVSGSVLNYDTIILWDSWSEKAKSQYERIVSGMGGDFEKMLNRELPFETYEDIEVAINTQFGIIDMNNVPKYDLFLQE